MNPIESPVNPIQKKLEDIEIIAEETSKERINPNDFIGHPFFNEEEIIDDLAHCKEKEINIAEQNKKFTPEQAAQIERGLAAEYTFRHAIEEYGWLAEKVNMFITSQFDDYFRGIDSIAQIDLGPGRYEHIGFALDFATSPEDIGNKLRHSFDAIDNGFTPSVKYFDSEKTGKLKNFKVPRIVIGTSGETLQRLVNYSSEIMNGSVIAESNKKAIKEDPFKHVIFGEIIAQLSTFCNRLEKVITQARSEKRVDVEKRATESLKIHKNALKVIQELANERKSDMATIHKTIRSDHFAVTMGSALSVLSMTPINFSKPKNK